MRLKSITLAAAILWGACMLVVGLINLRAASYGADFLRVMSSVYPGFHASRRFGDVIVGTIYGFVDGAIMGFVFGVLYRWTGGRQARTVNPVVPSTTSTELPLRRAS